MIGTFKPAPDVDPGEGMAIAGLFCALAGMVETEINPNDAVIVAKTDMRDRNFMIFTIYPIVLGPSHNFATVI